MSVLTSSKTIKIASRNSFTTLEGIKPPNYNLSPIGLTPPNKAFFFVKNHSHASALACVRVFLRLNVVKVSVALLLVYEKQSGVVSQSFQCKSTETINMNFGERFL